MGTDIQEELQAINAKIDMILAAVNDLLGRKRARAETKKARKEKLSPLTEEEIKEHEKRFVQLFDQWMEGHELEVQTELEKFDAEQIRRFADANNLNVTSKMSVQKVLRLISARFREKRQLQVGIRGS
ncbi:MAG: hypothetical protein HY098_06015 [Nitrospinae bacterium]|nr:hypothetical protein [Nitrospinota bacterium]